MSAPILEPGTTVKNRYVVTQLLGRGGMGEVHRAVDSQTGKPVAIKVLTRTVQTALDLVHEARAIARLRHPNIIGLVDFGLSSSNRFMVLEYCAGRPLSHWMRTLGVAEMVELLDKVLAALAYAHARGVVHRDLKPDNILIVEEGDGSLEPRLLDFGVAIVGEMDAKLASKAVGTPAYMSPEMVRGDLRVVGRESDLYAIGIMLFQYLSGKVPFRAANTAALLFQHLSAEVPELRPRTDLNVTPELVSYVRKLLAKRPEDRFRSAADAMRALRRLDRAQDLTLVTAPGTIDFESQLAAMRTQASGQVPNTFDHRKADGVPATHHADENEEDDVLLKTFIATHPPLKETVESTAPPELADADHLELVGRAEERDAIWSHLENMLESRSVRVAVIRGPAGVGKSRLARWLAEHADEEGLLRPVSCGVGDFAVEAGGGLESLLERQMRVAHLDRDSLEQVLIKELVAHGQLRPEDVPQVLDFLRPHESDAVTSASSNPVGLVARMLREAATDLPILIWLDDVDGPASAEFLQLIELLVHTRRLTRARLMIVATVRDQSAASTALYALAENDPRAVREFTLAPLADAEIGTLVDAIISLEPGLRERVVRDAKGLPGTAVETVLAWSLEGRLERTGLGKVSLRGSLEDVGYDRTTLQFLRLLASGPSPETMRSLIEVAAVIGGHFSLSVVRSAARSRGIKEDIDELVPWLVQSAIWVPMGGDRMRWGATDIAVRVEETLSHAERLAIHKAVGVAMISDGSAATHEEIAHHLVRGGASEDAIRYIRVAAHRALSIGRYRESRDLFQQAVELIDESALVDAVAYRDDADLGLARCALELAEFDEAEDRLAAVKARTGAARRILARGRGSYLQAELFHKRGQLDEAVTEFETAVETLASYPPDLARALLAKANLHSLRTEYDAALALARQVRGLVSHPLELARAAHIEARISALRFDLDNAEVLMTQACAAFRGVGAHHDLAHALLGLSDTLYNQGRFDESLATAGESLSAYLEVGDRYGLCRIIWARGTIHAAMENYASASEDFAVARDLAHALNANALLARVYCSLGELDRSLQRWESAANHYRSYLAEATVTGDRLSVAIAHANIALVLGACGRWDDGVYAARAALEEARALEHNAFILAFAAVVAWAEAELGNFVAAAPLMTESLERNAEIGLREKDYLVALEGFSAAARYALPELSNAALAAAKP